ncbi:type IIS restriction endonuclease [Desulfobulbus sp. Tol-SR]|nr:type IIS restriction endonuclease [Desulfobulbus sp. Tol-SR]
MNTTGLKKFAQAARRQLLEQVGARLKLVLQSDSAELREREKAVIQLRAEIADTSKAAVIERVAYIWFNRFCALRFMDVNRYTRIGTVSPAAGFSQPEILQDAKQGHIDDDLQVDRKQVFALLSGQVPAADPQQEAYRLLLVAVCNDYGRIMPFMFQRIMDYTELLLPDDLLSETSILQAIRQALTEETCQDVEVIGWLYQFYISEKKDEVFEGLKQNKKITPENIPAATQLFTPHWIVRYLVENSLGRLWLLNRPGSKLIQQMDYYIKPEQAETDFLRISTPEEIKICDPACGSGHMLTYAFDLLYAIYEEEGYEPAEIPEKILTQNLYGIEIDERAGELAAFALSMKARAKQRRFFNKGVKPNICVLQNVRFDEGELKSYMDFVGRDLFTLPLQTTLLQFQEADNFGSLIRPEITDVDGMLRNLESKNVSGQLFLSMTHQKVLQALRQADYLSPKYHVVIANPPYMGGKGMNGRLAAWLKDNYEDVKSDLFSAFIVCNTGMTLPKGQLGFMSPFVWMFISSYEKLRSFLINQKTITSLVQLEYSGFDGATVPICTFTIENAHRPDFKGGYVRLSDFRGSENQGPKTLEAIKNPNCGWFYRASAADFKKIPGSPIAYWVSYEFRHAFESLSPISEHARVRVGMHTGSNVKFVRSWSEVSLNKIGFSYTKEEDTIGTAHKWYPYNKGGSFRKWFGNNDLVVNWQNRGIEIHQFHKIPLSHNGAPVRAKLLQFRESVTWSFVSSAYFGVRYSPAGFMFDVGGSSLFPIDNDPYPFVGFLCSKTAFSLLKAMNPTLNFQVGNVSTLPFSTIYKDAVKTLSKNCIQFTKQDWDASETSWDFTSLPLLNPNYRQPTLKATYQKLRAHWREMTLEMQRLEEENNRIFIDAYGLQEELTPEVPLGEITLNCNPHYRYGGNKNDEELETLLLADTMKEFLSYGVGCMFGRYALDKPGLILANQGETIEDYLQQIPEPTFPADTDNVIPILDGEWFMDEIAGRFRSFLKLTFGEEHYDDNLKFLEEAIGKDIRKYFLKDFYADHVQRYKKRPIYWLFSSPKGSFNALISMHRYRPDTVSIILNDYLREFRTKLAARKEHLEQVSISASASKVEKTRALKEIGQLKQTIDELNGYENDILFPLATARIDIDLDDGVKVNYAKFGAALKKIPGLYAKED